MVLKGYICHVVNWQIRLFNTKVTISYYAGFDDILLCWFPAAVLMTHWAVDYLINHYFYNYFSIFMAITADRYTTLIRCYRDSIMSNILGLIVALNITNSFHLIRFLLSWKSNVI